MRDALPALFPAPKGSLAGNEAKLRLLLRTTGLIGLDPSDGDLISSSFDSTVSGAAGISDKGSRTFVEYFKGDDDCAGRTGDDSPSEKMMVFGWLFFAGESIFPARDGLSFVENMAGLEGHAGFWELLCSQST